MSPGAAFTDYGLGLAGDLFVHMLSGIHYITGTTAPPGAPSPPASCSAGKSNGSILTCS